MSMIAEPNTESPANVDAAKMWREDQVGVSLSHEIRIPIRIFDRIQVLRVTKDIYDYFHLKQNITQNQQIKALKDG